MQLQVDFDPNVSYVGARPKQSRDRQRSRESGSSAVVPVHNCKGIFCVALMDEKQRRPADVESRRRKLRLSLATTDTVATAATLTPVAAAVAAFQQSHHNVARAYLNEIENFMTAYNV